MSDVIMDGVWVLNVNHGQQGGDIATYVGFGALIGGLIGIAVLSFLWFFDGIYDGFVEFVKSEFPGVIACIVIFAAFGSDIGAAIRPDQIETTYDVIIGDNVSFNEFNEHYEIIEQNGNIYTVKEKRQ